VLSNFLFNTVTDLYKMNA